MSLLRKKHNDNHIIEDYLENKFNKHFIIPVVFDRRRKYRKIDTNDIVSNEEISQTDINEYKKDGVYTDDQRDQFKKLKLLDKKKLKFTDFLKETNELIKPYLLYDDKVKNGIEIEINESTELLRQFNSDGLDWRNRIAIAGHKYNQTDRSEDSGELETEEKVLTDGERVNISGFIKLPASSTSLYSDNNIDKFTKLNDITNIKFGEKTTITLENHNLETGSVVFIYNSNSSPLIDGKYIVDEVINNNKFTLDLNILSGEEGTHAECYTLQLLSYRTHKILKQKGKFVIQGSKDNNNSGSTTADLYLIEGVINKKDYSKLLKEIVPSYKDILDDEGDNIKNKNYTEINNVLAKYNITIQDLGNDEIDIIKKLLKEEINSSRFNKVGGSKKSSKKSINKENDEENKDNDENEENNKKIKSPSKNRKSLTTLKTSDLYDDKYLKDDIIKKYYGIYPLFGKQYDNYTQRSSFIDNSYDRGKLYYSFVLSHKNKELLSSYDISKLKNGLKELSKELDTKKTKLDDEKKVAKFINTDPCELKEDVLDEEDTKYDSLKNVCDFSNIDIEKLDIQKLQCYYFSNSCKNKKIHRLETRISTLEGIITKIEGIIKYSDTTLFNKHYKDLIETNKNYLERQIINFTKSEDKIEKVVPEQSKCAINETINKIIQEPNEAYKRYLLFKLIERDGLLIDKFIYSKTFKCPIICGHWHYLRRIYNSNSEEEKELLNNEMFGIYGDGGEESGNAETCTVCGNRLGLKKYDDIDGFSADGTLKIARQEWVEDEVLTDSKEISFYKIYTHEQFSRYIIEKGIKHSDTKIAMDIAIIIKNISMKIGIQFTQKDFIDVLLDSFNIIIELPDYKKYRMKEILKMKAKGFSKDKIIKLDEHKFFETTYKKTHLLKKVGIICAKILIYIQIAIPNYRRRKTDIKSVFHTFDGEEGVKYMATVIDEMKYFESVFQRKDKDKDEKIHDAVDFSYKQTLNQPKYKDAIYKKKEYIDSQEPVIKKIEKIPFKKTNIVIQNDYISRLKKSTGKETKELINKFLIYEKNISENIVDIVNRYVHHSIKLEPTIESSCCADKVGIDHNYHEDMIKTHPNIIKLMDEAKKIYNYTNSIKKTGIYSRYYSRGGIEYNIKDPFIYIRDDYITEDIILDTFLSYCSEGDTKGEKHNIINNTCIKCNKTVKDLKECKYTESDYEKLLDEIVKRNVIYNNNSNNSNNKIRKKATTLESALKDFHKNMSKFSPDKEKLTEDYFKDIGLYTLIYNVESVSSDKDKIITKQKLYNNRVEVLKVLINQYFKKYISLISNKMLDNTLFLDIEDDDDKVKKEIQDKISNEYKDFTQFTTKNTHIFSKIKFKETIKEINNIDYINHIYNCDYSKVVKHSQYTSVDASNYLMSILYNNLNNFFKEMKNEEEVRTLTLFILKIFDKFENYGNIVNVDEEIISSIQSSIDSAKLSKQSPLDKVLTNNPHTYIEDKDAIDAEKEVNMKDKVGKIENMIKDKLDSEGEETTPNDIEDMKDDILHQEHIDMEIEADEEGIDSGEIEAEFGLEEEML